MRILLASNSPRRKELLSALGYHFEVIRIDTDESYPSELTVSEIAQYISEKKANAYDPKIDEVVLTADTIVALNDEILLKPQNKEEAVKMLQKLSQNTHQVFTAFTLKTVEYQVSKTHQNNVTFSEIDQNEIQYYIDNFQPFDKAGSYGIQEWLGMAKIKSLSGSYYSVMGLPTDLVYKELKKIGILPHKF